MKYIIIQLMLIIFSVFNTNAQNKLSTTIKKVEKSVFEIKIYDKNKNLISSGTGFFIDRTGILVTNVHVIKDAYYGIIKTTANKIYEIDKIIDYNVNLDIAIVSIRNPKNETFPSLTPSANNCQKGDDIFTIGNPNGLENTVSSGIISAIRNFPNYGNCYQITAPISPGSSGGPLFNINGEVIGITTFGNIDEQRLNQNLNFAVDYNNLRFLNKKLNILISDVQDKIIYENYVSSYNKAELSGNFILAINICNKEIEKKPNDWLPYFLKASTNLGIGNYEDAEVDFLKSISKNNSITLKEYAYIGLGKIYRKAGQYKKAMDNYFEAGRINSDNAICYCNVASLAMSMNGVNNPTVEKYYKMALDIDPFSCALGYKLLGEKEMSLNNFRSAIPLFSNAILIDNGENTINEYYNRGICYFKINQYENAIADFKMCIKLSNNDYEALWKLGDCNLALGRKIESCIYYNQALENSKAYYNSNNADILELMIAENCN